MPFGRWVEVWAVGGQEDQRAALVLDDLADLVTFVGAEVVHDDDLAGLKCWRQEVLDEHLEGSSIQSSFERHHRLHTFQRQSPHHEVSTVVLCFQLRGTTPLARSPRGARA